MDPIETHKRYQATLKSHFRGQGEEMTDLEEFVTQFEDIEGYVNKKSTKVRDEQSDFHAILGEHITAEDLKKFEQQFDSLKQKYDSVYGEKQDKSAAEKSQFLDSKFVANALKNEVEAEDQDVDVETEARKLQSAEETAFDPTQTNNSIFGELLANKLSELENVVANKGRVVKLRALLEKINQVRIEEPGLLQSLIDHELKYVH